MTNILMRSDIVVRPIGHLGDDLSIIEDARTSLRKPGKLKSDADVRRLSDSEQARLVDFFTHRHASVLRGCVLKVEVECPIFVQRQLRTHWVGFNQYWPTGENDWLGFNDQSGKYARYTPQMWVPYDFRLEADGFDPMRPAFVASAGADEAWCARMQTAYQVSWDAYEQMIADGISREIARAVLPEGLYVAGRITANLNGWFGLLSLRIDHPANSVATYPQLEIQQLAEQVEHLIKGLWPQAHAAWQAAGRTRP